MKIQEECLSMQNEKDKGRKSSDTLVFLLVHILRVLILNKEWAYHFSREGGPASNMYVDVWSTPFFAMTCDSLIRHSCGALKLTDTQLLLVFIAIMYPWFNAGDASNVVDFALKCLFHEHSSSAVKFLLNIKVAIGLRHGNTQIPHLNEWLSVLKWPDEMIQSRRKKHSESISNRMTHPIDVDWDHVMNAMKRWTQDGESGKPLSAWLAVQLSVGCRSQEVVDSRVTFRIPTELERGNDRFKYIVQEGQSKNNVNGIQTLIRPILRWKDGWEANDIVRVVESIRAAVEKEKGRSIASSRPTFWNNAYNGKLNRLLNSAFRAQKSFAKEHGLPFGTQFLRALYAFMMWESNKNLENCPSQTKFISDVLGHNDPSFDPSKHYECIRIKKMPSGTADSIWDEDWNTKKTKKNVKVRVEVKDDIQNQTDDDVSTEETFKNVIKKVKTSDDDVKPKKSKKRVRDDEECVSAPKANIGAVRQLDATHIAVLCSRVLNDEGSKVAEQEWVVYGKFTGKGHKEKTTFAWNLMLELGSHGVAPTAAILQKFGVRVKSLPDEMKERLCQRFNTDTPSGLQIAF